MLGFPPMIYAWSTLLTCGEEREKEGKYKVTLFCPPCYRLSCALPAKYSHLIFRRLCASASACTCFLLNSLLFFGCHLDQFR